MSGVDECQFLSDEPGVVTMHATVGVYGGIPQYISSEDTVELGFWWRLPLDHNGLVCPPTGYNILGWCAGRLLPQHQSNTHN